MAAIEDSKLANNWSFRMLVFMAVSPRLPVQDSAAAKAGPDPNPCRFTIRGQFWTPIGQVMIALGSYDYKISNSSHSPAASSNVSAGGATPAGRRALAPANRRQAI